MFIKYGYYPCANIEEYFSDEIQSGRVVNKSAVIDFIKENTDKKIEILYCQCDDLGTHVWYTHFDPWELKKGKENTGIYTIKSIVEKQHKIKIIFWA